MQLGRMQHIHDGRWFGTLDFGHASLHSHDAKPFRFISAVVSLVFKQIKSLLFFDVFIDFGILDIFHTKFYGVLKKQSLVQFYSVKFIF